MIINYIIILCIGYLLGCSNLAFFLGKAKGFDIREYGSNNAGASNATITMGAKIGFIVGWHDVLKSTLAVLIVSYLFPLIPGAGAIAGAMAVFGHIFPFYLKFKGGKGFASFMGMILGLDWKFFLALVVIVLLVTFITDYIVIGTFTSILSFPIYAFIMSMHPHAIIAIIMASLLIFIKHFINIKRLFTGEEIGLRRALSKKDKVENQEETIDD